MTKTALKIIAAASLTGLVGACAQYPTDTYPRKAARAEAAAPEAPTVAARGPTGANPYLAPRAIAFRFESGGSALGPDDLDRLDAFVDEISRLPGVRVEVEGHADRRGAASENELLAQARADAVRQALVERGVEVWRSSAKGYGERRQLDEGRRKDSLAKNRRVLVVATPHLQDVHNPR